jgi:uncharacterized protein
MFIFINFVITWGAWGSVILLSDGAALKPGSVSFVLFVLGGLLGPVVAAVVSKKMYSNRADFRFFLFSLVKVKVHVKWYALAILTPFFLTFIPRFTNWLGSGELDLSMEQPLFMSVATLPIYIIAGGLEEVGWRGVLLPELHKKVSALAATFLVSVIWAIWHLPLWFIVGTSQNGSDFTSFAVGAVGLSLILSIIYIRTESIFLCIVFHSFFNSYHTNIGMTEFSNTSAEWLATFVKLLFCAILFLWYLRSGKKFDYSDHKTMNIK